MTCRAATSATTCAGSSPTGAQLAYDNEGQLAAWQNAPGSSPTASASYLYDGAGQRVEQVATTNGTMTTTAYIGSLEEIATSGSTTTTTAYYGGLATSVNGALSYTLADGLGSVSEAVNTTTGAVTATQLYAPYGAVRSASGTLPGSHGFTGQRSDAATSGLDYYGARYYDPAAGQFTSADTTLAGGLNRYAYVSGNPESRTDPSGHALDTLQGTEGPALTEVSVPQVFQDAFDNSADLNPDLPPASTSPSATVGGTSYVENPDGSLTVTQTSDGQFVRLDTYGQTDAGYKQMLALLVSALNGVNASTLARMSEARHQTNALTGENDQPPTPPTTSPTTSSSPTTTGGGAPSAPQPATGGAGAMHGSGSDMCGCGGVVYVIGESMNRVIPAADAAGQRYYKPWVGERAARATNDMMTRDRNWLLWVMHNNFWIRDIGYDPNPSNRPQGPSAFYQMERDLIAERNYPYYCFDPQP